MQVLIEDTKLLDESPDSSNGRYGDNGPTHAYQMPLRVPGGAGPTKPNTKNKGNFSYDAEAEERLPLRLRGVKAAYGRALGTAGKLCLDKHASTIGGHPESAAQAWGHLKKAVEVRGRHGALVFT